MRHRISRSAAIVALAAAAALGGCSPKADPKPQTDQTPTETPAPAVDVTTPSWVTVHGSTATNGAPPVQVCHVSPAINEDLTVTLVFDDKGQAYVGGARIALAGKAQPIGEVTLQVDGGAPHHIAPGMPAIAQAVWPPGAAAIASGPEAKAMLAEMQAGASIQLKEGGATRSFPAKGLAEAVAECAKP